MSISAKKKPGQRIGVAGAGSIGCFVGGLLAAAGHDVILMGRSRVLDPVRDRGLRLTGLDGLDVQVAPERLVLSTDPAALAQADIVLVTVKTGATREMAEQVAAHTGVAVPVVGLQNGHAAAEALRAGLDGRDVRAGMVPFNVVPKGPGHFHRATSGDIVIGSGPTDLSGLSVPGLPVGEVPDIEAVQWGKLIVNLNNAVNALSGVTVQQQLLDRTWRRLMADQMAEALTVLRAAGIAERSTAPVPSRAIPFILRLPTPLFRRLAAQMIAIDAEARTSMAYDLDAGRVTEIDALQGEIVRLGQMHGVATPICAHIAGLVARAEPGTVLPAVALRP